MKMKLSLCLVAVALIGMCVVIAAPIIMDDGEDEKEVTIDQVPAAVKATILKEAGKNKITEIEEVSKDGKVIYYEAEIKVDGKEIDIMVAPDGKLLGKEIEDDDDEDDDDDDDDDD